MIILNFRQISQKPSPLVTFLNLKGSNSCLDLVGGQHRDIFLQPAASDQNIRSDKQFTCDQLLLVARVSEC